MTACIASTNASQPRTSTTDVNTPAIEVTPVSSTVEEERTTSGRSPCRERSRQADSICASTCSHDG
jgi:hypothetical protein